MGQFKPMVKMMTTEPTVELKLKKGGHVHMKKGGKAEHGHKSMHHSTHKMDGGVMGALAGTPALVGRPAVNAPVAAPGRPSMAARRKAMAGRTMNTPVMKKGGKAHHHAHGGEMETPKQHKAEMHEMHKIEKELKHHEHLPAGKAHHGLKHGGKAKKHHYATGGVALSNAGGYKKGGHVKHHATGGEIPEETTHGKYVTTEVHEASKRNPSKGTKAVKNSNAGGYKKGGHVKHHATGGAIPEEKTHGKYVTTEVHEASKRNPKVGTGGVSYGNAGGYKKGGAAKKLADGGRVQDDGRPVKMPQGRKKPTPPVDITMLSGTFKKGGHVKKKADGGVMEQYAQQKADEASRRAYELQGAREREENESLRNAMSPARLLEKAREMFRGVGAVSDVEREKARTVVPAKKYGGKAC